MVKRGGDRVVGDELCVVRIVGVTRVIRESGRGWLNVRKERQKCL